MYPPQFPGVFPGGPFAPPTGPIPMGTTGMTGVPGYAGVPGLAPPTAAAQITPGLSAPLPGGAGVAQPQKPAKHHSFTTEVLKPAMKLATAALETYNRSSSDPGTMPINGVDPYGLAGMGMGMSCPGPTGPMMTSMGPMGPYGPMGMPMGSAGMGSMGPGMGPGMGMMDPSMGMGMGPMGPGMYMGMPMGYGMDPTGGMGMGMGMGVPGMGMGDPYGGMGMGGGTW